MKLKAYLDERVTAPLTARNDGHAQPLEGAVAGVQHLVGQTGEAGLHALDRVSAAVGSARGQIAQLADALGATGGQPAKRRWVPWPVKARHRQRWLIGLLALGLLLVAGASVWAIQRRWELTEAAEDEPDDARVDAPAGDALPGAGRIVPVAPPAHDQALGIRLPQSRAAQLVNGGPSVPPAEPSVPPVADPLPGAGSVVPTSPPPEDRALGVPLPLDAKA